jgi:hypothetical protein
MKSTDHRAIITKLRKPRINEEKRKIIVQRAASGDLLKGIPPVSFLFLGGRTTISTFGARLKKQMWSSFCEWWITHDENIRRGGNVCVRIS